MGFTAQRPLLTWRVEKKLMRTNWKRNNENQVKIKHETIDFRVAEQRRELFDLSPELGEVTQPQAVVFSLVPMLCEHKKQKHHKNSWFCTARHTRGAHCAQKSFPHQLLADENGAENCKHLHNLSRTSKLL